MKNTFLFPFLFITHSALSYNLTGEIIDSKYQSSSYIERPNFYIFNTNQSVQLNGDHARLKGDSQYFIQNVDVFLESAFSKSNITSEEANYDKNLETIEFEQSVQFSYSREKDNFSINTEFLIFNIANSKLFTDQRAEVNFNTIKINSDGVILETQSEIISAEFKNGNLEIQNTDSIYKGAADKIIILSEDNTLILEGQAIFDQGGLILKADLIHYDYQKNQILKSINSEIKNQI